MKRQQSVRWSRGCTQNAHPGVIRHSNAISCNLNGVWKSGRRISLPKVVSLPFCWRNGRNACCHPRLSFTSFGGSPNLPRKKRPPHPPALPSPVLLRAKNASSRKGDGWFSSPDSVRTTLAVVFAMVHVLRSLPAWGAAGFNPLMPCYRLLGFAEGGGARSMQVDVYACLLVLYHLVSIFLGCLYTV